MRHITQEGINLICRFEGFSSKVYICPAGYPTIGYGHLIRPENKAQFSGPITKAQAEVLLRKDVETAEQAVLRLVTVPLTDGQFDALVSFVFNLGAGAFQGSTLRSKINRGEHADAAKEFEKWIFAGGKKLSGLVARRAAEAERYMERAETLAVADTQTDTRKTPVLPPVY
ncbi:MAG: muraminidase [Rickettsiales bacterium]|jgi:GH24 family phage-related lysozyme (muramidase)|nr:muraminidase [Rickettsiales bacterium]